MQPVFNHPNPNFGSADLSSLSSAKIDQLNTHITAAKVNQQLGNSAEAAKELEQAQAIIDEADENPPEATWTETPKEMARQTSEPIVVSTSPDVVKTPVGSSTPPIPYSIHATLSETSGTATTVKATDDSVFTVASDTVSTSGAEPGVAKGKSSGTVNEKAEPVEHSTTVRVEGNPVVRHGDQYNMNNANTVGEIIYIEDTTPVEPYPQEESQGEEEDQDDRNWFQRRWDDTKDVASSAWDGAQELNEEYSITTRAVGAVQTIGGAAEAIVGGGMVVGGVAASTTGAGALVGVPTAVGGGALAAKGADDFWHGLKTIWTGEFQDTYLDQGIAAAGNAMGLSESQIQAAQIGAGMIGPPSSIAKEGAERLAREGAEEGLERGAREGADDAAEETSEASEEAASRVTAKPKPKCFKKPKRKKGENETPEETERLDKEFDDEWNDQLRLQQEGINNMTAQEMHDRQRAIEAAGGTDGVREEYYQRLAKQNAEKELASQGYTPQEIKKMLEGKHALHRTDIRAGGDPTDIVRMGDGTINSSIGSQWAKSDRWQSLDKRAEQMIAQGDGDKKMDDVVLKTCGDADLSVAEITGM